MTLVLIALPLVMFVATFVAGILPLKLTVAQHHLKYLSFLSMGILIGTAMMIILPEGIETISHETTDVALYVGFPILLGFLTMYILDCMFSTNVKAQESSVVESVVGSPITLGLIFHGIIDGISLGSSLASGEVMTLIIFAAIIIHKIPTSFSLSTILLQEGTPDSKLYWHILLFALLSPSACWFTFVLIKLVNAKSNLVIGVLFLYSAGTFLFVVNHVMHEFSSNDFYTLPTSVESDTTTVESHSKISRNELILSLIGILIPTLLSFAKE